MLCKVIVWKPIHFVATHLGAASAYRAGSRPTVKIKLMRIQIASDLHLEFLEQRFPNEIRLQPVKDADLLILAGDISNGSMAIRHFKDWPVPVVYVIGNHELYTNVYEDVIDAIRRDCAGTSIHFLERDTLEFKGTRIVGCTLWTDYLLLGHHARPRVMEHARGALHDHSLIKTRLSQAFLPVDALSDHEISRTWLEDTLAGPFDGSTVVVTHHAPHPGSVHPRYEGSNLNAAFTSDLTPLVDMADIWVHGHMHNSSDYRVGRCRIVSNPRGYPINGRSAAAAAELRFENPDFDEACVVDTSEQPSQD